MTSIVFTDFKKSLKYQVVYFIVIGFMKECDNDDVEYLSSLNKFIFIP